MIGIDEETDVATGDGDVYVVEARDGDGWRELERTTSRGAAEEALDQLAARQGIDLGDLRVRVVD
jgi:hypothetical protein